MAFEKLKIEEYIAALIQNIVDKPESVKVSSTHGERTIVLSITADRSDIGKIVGRKGNVISAIRTLGRCYVGASGMRLEINVID